MFKIEDVVWDVAFGRGKVVSISGDHSHALIGYPIVVCLDSRTNLGFNQFLVYDNNGFTKGAVNRSLYFSEPVVTGECNRPFERAFVDGELYIARSKEFADTAYAFIVTGENEDKVYAYIPPSKGNTTLFIKSKWIFHKPGEEVEIE